jgi:hypothetical protein
VKFFYIDSFLNEIQEINLVKTSFLNLTFSKLFSKSNIFQSRELVSMTHEGLTGADVCQPVMWRHVDVSHAGACGATKSCRLL